MLMRLSKEVDETVKAAGMYGTAMDDWSGKIKILEDDQDKYWKTQADINAGVYDCGTGKFWTSVALMLVFAALGAFAVVWIYLLIR